MPRPRHMRRIAFEPGVTYFKPAGIRIRELEEVRLTKDELEALRLKDVACLEQTGAAEEMGVSQPTFHRILLNARKKTAEALVNGKAIRIEGGDNIIRERISQTDNMFHTRMEEKKSGGGRYARRRRNRTTGDF